MPSTDRSGTSPEGHRLLRERIAEWISERLFRLARRVGDLSGPQEPNVFSLALFRLAEAVVALCGGRLESRIMTFRAPEGPPDEHLAHALDLLRSTLEASGIPLRVAQTTLSREEAWEEGDDDDLPPEGAANITVYECFVRLHHCWRASAIGQAAIRPLHEDVRNSGHDLTRRPSKGG